MRTLIHSFTHLSRHTRGGLGRRTDRRPGRVTARRFLAAASVLALTATACGSDDDDADPAASQPAATEVATTDVPAATDAPAQEAAEDPFAPGVLASGATLARFDLGDVTVHTYTNPEAGFGNTTAIIESANAVVLIDAHFGEAPASEFRSYAESLGKPIDRLILTHEHPDHIGGVEPVFSDVTSTSSVGVIEAAAAVGTTIDEALDAGEVTIDGVRYVFEVFADAEADEQVVTSLPDLGVVFPGDLVYYQYHPVMSPTFENWLAILDDLATREGVELVVPGHGPPAGPEAFDDIIDYLGTAAEVYAASDDGATFNAAMVDAYPDRAGANLLDFGVGRLFPKSGS